MRTRMAAGLALMAAGLVALMLATTSSVAAQDKSKLPPPKHLYGHDLKVRPGGERDWPKALKIGVELFHHEETKSIIAISDVGSISVAPAPVGVAVVGSDKTCKWLTAHDLNCRKVGEREFTQKTKKWGVELFQDRGTNRLLYVCESGSVALAPVPGELVTEKGPKWHHALELRVRAPEQREFANAKKIGLEVFKDENTGGLIYITETGAIATAAAPATAPDPSKPPLPPKTQYGLSLRVRGTDETEFTDKTKQLSVEVFEDPNANTMLYVTEGGFIATAPFKKWDPNAAGVPWKSAMALRSRKAGDDWSKARKFGIEVFEDNRTGNLIFICETGSIAVLPK